MSLRLKMAARWLVLLFLIEIFSQVAASVRCIHKGKQYHPGEKFSKSCNTCYCLQHGDWLCTQRTCRLADFRGILLIPSNDVILSRGSKLYVICRSDRKSSRFMWFVNGQHMTSPSKVSSILKYGESVLQLDERDFKRKSTYVTCFVPPFAPKRIKVTIADGPSLPMGVPRIASQPVVIETSPNYGVSIQCRANGLQPLQVTWFKFRVPLSNENPTKWFVTPDGTLIIPTPVKSDSGLYECMVTNEIGAAISSHATELVVNKGLPIKGAWCGWKQTSDKCNATCGGYLHFKRECACPAPKNGGADCSGLKKKLVACNVDHCFREIYGKVNVEKMRNEDILMGSCLHIGYMPFTGCLGKKDCEASSLITIRDFRIHQDTFHNYIRYNMRLPSNLRGEFKFAALLQLGHCQEDLTAYELFEKDCVKPVGDQVNPIGVLSASSSRILVTLDAQYEEKSQVLRSTVSFRPTIAKLPQKSCLQILFWNDVKCHGPTDCMPLQILQVPNPTIEDWKVSVNITILSALDPGTYLIDGYLNIGWCAEDSKEQQRTRVGDYASLKKKYLFVNQMAKEYQIELTMDKIREIEEKKDLPLNGIVKLQGYPMETLPRRSCLIVELREVYKCNNSDGCRRPYVNEERVELTNAVLRRVKDASEFPYRVLFRNVFGNNFEVNGIVNVGWCKYFVKGNRRTRLDDYFTVQSHELNVEHGINGDPINLRMSKIHSSDALKKKTVQGRIKYESGLSNNLLEKSCMRLILVKYDCSSSRGCKKIPFITKTYKNLLASVKNTFSFKIKYRGQRKFSELHLYAVMNIGWCSEGQEEAASLRPGDLVGFVEIKKRNLAISIKLEKQSKFKVIDTPFRKAELDKGSSKSKFLLSLPSDFDGTIPSSSCMVVTIREEESCQNKVLCSSKVVATKVFRSIMKSENNSVQIDMSLEPALEINLRYQFDIVLNNGWCSEGTTNDSWIKDGDLYTSFEQQFNSSAKNIIENIALRVFKDDDQKAEKCNIKCPKLLDPVCGSDNRTYNSFCVLKREACIFESGVTLLHKGECERCKRGCSTKIEPICARNGKTYDNLCIMEREACFEGSSLAFRHYGKCGSVTMRGDIRFSIDQSLPEVTNGSCLVIKTRKAVYCKFPERCPDYELAEVVLKDAVVPPDGKIPFEVVMNPRPMSSVYLVEAVLNQGWCSAESSSKEWIRNEDYFNVKEQPFAVQGSEEIYKDVSVTKLINLKVVEKGTIPSAIRDPCSIIECPFHGKCHMINGKATCRCKLMCRLDTEPVCGSDGETYANECVMKSESCLSKQLIEVQHKGRCENTLKISGDILVDQLIPRIPVGSCVIIRIQKNCNESKEKCDFETLAEIRRKNVLIPPSNRLYYQTIMKPRPPSGVYIISVVLNRGWCADNQGNTEWIRIGDYLNYFRKEFVISETGNIEKDIVIMRFVPKNGEKNYVVVEGEVLLDGIDSRIANGSCMSIALHHENGSCEGGCKTQPVVRFYVKNLSMLSSKKIPYRAVIEPRPMPGSYILSVILNQGWCSEGSNELIREGDLFINEGQKLEIGLAGDVYRDVKIEKYYPPGMPCMTKDSNEVPNGADMTVNGNGCHGCKCSNGSIICQPTACPPLDCPNGFLAIEDGDCCPKCVRYTKCYDLESGRNYKNGEKIFSRGKDYCKTCSCNMTGKFSCSKEVCPQLDCKEQIYIKSSCCPVCSSDIRCKHHKSGMLYKAGETWINGDMNGCSKCKCVTKPGSNSLGFIECIKPSCPRLNCIQQVYPKGYCCPVCLKEKANGPFKEEDVSYLQALIFNEVVSSEVSCSDSASGKIYVEGEKWSHGCMDYECKRSGIESKAKSCPYLTCPQKYHVIKPGDCCPSCSAECLPKLLCTDDSVVLIVPRVFLPYTRPTELVFNNCTSSVNATHFILKTAFNQCGMKRSIEGDLMTYSNIAYTREDEDAVISRVQLVQIPVACIYPAYTQRILSREFIKRNRGISVISPIPKDTGPVKAFDVFMRITDEEGVEQDSGKPMKFDPGEKVYVEIDGTGLVENKIKVKADYCYLTPTPGPKSLLNYTLIENGCGIDSTVEFQESKGNGQRFSFRALIFTKIKVPGFYLHCDSVTCDEEDPNCTTGCRTRRALPQNQANIITREKAADHKRKMKLTLHVVLG